MEREISLINDKIEKLTQALRNRLFEIEVEDQQSYGTDKPLKDFNHELIKAENDSLSDRYSNLYAYGLKVLDNNDDPNQLLIMQKMIEDFLTESET